MATINNKQSITTAANQAHIFVLAQPGDLFINRGSLSTSGNQASSIVVEADDVTVLNFAALTASGLDSPVIRAGQVGSGVDNVTIINNGSIVNTGLYADLNANNQFDIGENFPDGIVYYGTNGLVENRGSITVLTRSGAAIGLLGSDTTVVNSGQIEANIFGIVVDSYGGGMDRNTIINEGLIRVSSGSVGGVGIDVRSNDNIVINEGGIVAQGTEYIGLLLRGSANLGENRGTISASGADSTGVYLYGDGHAFINEGTIEAAGVDSAGVRFGADNPTGLDTGTFTNRGTISAEDYAVLGSAGDETVINRGLISGHVDLGGGDDVYIAGRKSSLQGVLHLGDGDDLIVVQTGSGDLVIEDFMAGAGTDDVIDVSAFGITSLSDLLNRTTQSGSFVSIDLGKTDLLLAGVNMSALNSGDFIFG